MALRCYITIGSTDTYYIGTDLYTRAKIFVHIINENDQPTNANNATIEYSINDDGVISTAQKTISGQGALLFYGVIEKAHDDGFGGYTPYYSKTFGFATVLAQTDTPQPPVNSCDVHIDLVNIDKPGSAPGAADGQITVSAGSSYLPLQYSLDNITFQSSATFTGITGGSKTVYVKDGNSLGCLVSMSVTIPVLSRLLVNDPSATVNGNISRWNAAFNPVVFTYQRKDIEVTNIVNNSVDNNAKLFVNANVSSLIENDRVYINAGAYTGVFNVKTSYTNTLVIDTPFVGSATGFINVDKLKPYYKMLTKVTYYDPLTGVQNTIRSTNRPDTKGLIKADLSNFLQSLVRPNDDSNYTQANFRDNNLSASYQVAYAECWDDGTADGKLSDWVEIAEPYYVVYAAKQLGDRYGGNLAAYVPFANGQPAAKWISDFAEPAYSEGYPFDIGFIYSEQLGGLQLYTKIRQLDINRNELSGGEHDNYLLNNDGSWLLYQDAGKLLISRATVSNSPITRQLGLNRLLINNTFQDQAYYFVVGIYHNGSAPAIFNYRLTEAISPHFIDGNGQLKDNTIEVADIYGSGTGTQSIAAGDAYSFEVFVNEASAATNPAMRLTITKDETVIFDKQISATAGASIIKTGIAQPGAIYNVSIITADTTDIVTEINIADDQPFTGTEVQVVKDQVVRIDKSIEGNSVYLRWIGLTGSWNYYRFVYNQEVTLDVQNATIIKNFVSDWENQDGIEDVISKTAGQKMKVMAEDLSVADIKGLQSIKYSPKVQLLVSRDPIKWQTIVINTATFAEYETLNGHAPFSVTFNLPGINIQTQ